MHGRMVAKGRTAEIYEYGRDKVIKLFRDGFPFELCRQEFEITTQLYAGGVACPNPYALIEMDGRTGIVYERVKGKSLLQKMRNQAWTLKSKAKELAVQHRGIQQPVNFDLISVKEKLQQQINAAEGLTTLEKEQLRSCLYFMPDGNTLCHFDFHPGNILLAKKCPVTIDWLTAAKGDPLADVARTVVILKYSQLYRGNGWAPNMAKSMQGKILQHYLEEYMAQTGCKLEAIERWELPVMAGRLCEWIPRKEKELLLKLIRDALARQQKKAIA